MKNKVIVKRCKDCGKILSKSKYTYCKSCVQRGKRNHNFQHGNTHNAKCVDCGKKIGYNSWKYGLKRCKSCAIKYLYKTGRLVMNDTSGKKNGGYKTGKYCKKYYCIICGKEISCSSGISGKGMCKSCSHKELHLTKEAKEKLSKMRTGKNNPMFGKLTHGKRQYFKGSYMRSSWEVAYAKYCLKNKIKYRYESKTFDLGNMTYTPDFYLPETNEYIEIKGWWRSVGKVKFNAFKKQYPTKNIKVLMKKELLDIGVNL